MISKSFKNLQRVKAAVKLTKNASFNLPQALNRPAHVDLSDTNDLLLLQGKDTIGMLQGVTTVDIQSFINSKDQGTLYGLFLNSKGRVISDSIFSKLLIKQGNGVIGKEESLVLEIPKENNEVLRKHLKKYTFRKKVEILDLSEAIESHVILVFQFEKF